MWGSFLFLHQMKNKSPFLFNSLFFLCLMVIGIYSSWIISHLELQSYDEARVLLSAWEMQKSGDWIGITYHGKLDHIMVKPPLFTWLAALSFKVFGFHEWAGRLPSMLFGFGTLILFYLFLLSIIKDYVLSILISVGLAISFAFIGQHGITSGEYDSTLNFFVLLSFISIYKLFFEQKGKWVYLLAISLGLGFMTKSILGLLPMASILPAYFLNRGNSIRIAVPTFTKAIMLFTAIVFPYMIIREMRYQEHYLLLLFQVDVFTNMTHAILGHEGSMFYYLKLIKVVFKEWSAMFFVAFVFYSFYLLNKGNLRIRLHKPLNKTILFMLFPVVFYLVIFTLARFKAIWYMNAMLPMMTLFTSIVLTAFIKENYRWLLYAILTVIVFYEGRNLYIHDQDRMNRDYETMTKNILLPNKAIMMDKSVISCDSLMPASWNFGMMPSSLAYIDIFSGGRHTILKSYEGLNEHIVTKMDFDLVIVADTSKLLHKDQLNLVAAKDKMGMYAIKR